MNNDRVIDVVSANKKIIIANIIRVFLLISIFVEFYYGRWPIFFVNLLGFILTFLPWAIDKVFSITLFRVAGFRIFAIGSNHNPISRKGKQLSILGITSAQYQIPPGPPSLFI